MKRTSLLFVLYSLTVFAYSQVESCATHLRAVRPADVTIPFRYADTGKPTPIEWGLDVAWISEDNIRFSTAFAGKELIDIVRTSFRPTQSVADGELSSSQMSFARKRADIIKKYLKPGIQVNINSDPGDEKEPVDAWYNTLAVNSATRGRRWAQCIDLHADYYKSLGLTNLVSISPFNEPDFGWNQGANSSRMSDMREVCKSLKSDYDGKYDDVRICGGNTLNDDCAFEWWNYMKEYLDEGNTHQLAGNFDNYASFFARVREYGHHATADELHNIMDAMVGVEYGMQTGIWWGSCEYTRSQFMKATSRYTPGFRLGYGENREHWVAGSVYRHADGLVQGFAGTSERQAWATDFRYVALDRPVWYNGQRGREFVIHTPGGKDYQKEQRNCETVFDIQGGDDVMPYIDSTVVYKIMNVKSGLLLGTPSKPTSGWTSLSQRKNNNTYKFLQWRIYPKSADGDMCYCFLELNTDNGMLMDILNWNAEDGADLGVYPGGKGVVEQFYLQYAGNGAYYIRSRFGNKCVEVKNGSTTVTANVQMGDFKGEDYQQWRFISANVVPDLVAPSAPLNLQASEHSASVLLSWSAPSDKDVRSYTILRSEDGIEYYTLENNIQGTSFVDNETKDGVIYHYKVYAEDKSLNRSSCSNVVTAQTSMQEDVVMHLPLTSDLQDLTSNANNAAMSSPVFSNYKGEDCLTFNGTGDFVQLPYAIANHGEMSISFWVYYRGGSQWQRIFDFGNGTEQYMFLTPQCGNGLEFAIKNGGEEQIIRPGKSLLTTRWHHIVVTLGQDGGCLYLNGELIGKNSAMSIKPIDFTPVLNYIGRSQYAADPYFKGYLHDFSLYNYVLTSDQVADMATGISAPIEDTSCVLAGQKFDLVGRPATRESRIYIQNQQVVIER